MKQPRIAAALLVALLGLLALQGWAMGETVRIIVRAGDSIELPPGTAYTSTDPRVVAVNPSGSPCYAAAPGEVLLQDGERAVRVIVLPASARLEFAQTAPLYVGETGTKRVSAVWSGVDRPEALPRSEYQVQDPEIARYEDGVITGLRKGATALVARGEGGVIKVSIPVIVIMREPCRQLKATIPYRFRVGESRIIDAYPKPVDTSDELRYISASPGILTVDDAGIMTAHAAGKALVFVRCGDQTVSQTVYVSQ